MESDDIERLMRGNDRLESVVLVLVGEENSHAAMRLPLQGHEQPLQGLFAVDRCDDEVERRTLARHGS
jgi:hypothetical protein